MMDTKMVYGSADEQLTLKSEINVNLDEEICELMRNWVQDCYHKKNIMTLAKFSKWAKCWAAMMEASGQAGPNPKKQN